MGEGDVMSVGGCLRCTCSRGQTSCDQDPNCKSSGELAGEFIVLSSRSHEGIYKEDWMLDLYITNYCPGTKQSEMIKRVSNRV